MRRRAFERLGGFALSSLLLVSSSLALSGCGGAATVAPAKPPPAPAAQPIPPCPESILPGGDPLEAAAFEGRPVVRVCVVGGTEESRRTAQRTIDLRPSELATGERVRADLEALMKLGTFDDASAYGLRVQQGKSVVLFYAVHDRPRIAEIGFAGAKVLGDASLNAKLPFAKESPYEPAKVNVVAQAVRDEYRARGYESCSVKLVTEPAATPGAVRVRIEVDEGPLWQLTKIDFRGNKRISEAELRKVSGLKVGQPFVREEVERAGLLVSALYYERGFVDLRLRTENGTTAAPGALPVTFVIEEGDVHTLGALHTSKLGAPVEKELLEKVVRARPKQVFARSQIVEDIERLKAWFARKGQQVEVVPTTSVDTKKKTVDLTFEIEAR